MRLSPLPPPAREALKLLRVHEVVRDYPELLTTLEQLGVDPREEGSRILDELEGYGEAREEEILMTLNWRMPLFGGEASRG